MDAFTPREAALEYWFWTFHAGDLAFLVDFIVRRRTGEGEIRVSLWIRGQGRVEHFRTTAWSADANRITIGDGRLSPDGSSGAVADIAWDLSWSAGETAISPTPGLSGRAHPLDLRFLLRPDARFDGSVRVGGETFAVANEPGSFTHYWGRRLPDQWLWISATRFEGHPEQRLEAAIGRSRLWGTVPMATPIAYVWITDGRRSELTISPLNGLVRQRRDGGTISIDVRRWNGRRHRITCRAGTSQNDLGEGIRQTLSGELTLDGVSAVAGAVGVETRGWPL
jgi:hypothetical protein